MSEHEKASFFDRLQKGFQESIAYSRGQLTLQTTELPAPPPKAKAVEIIDLRKRFRMSQAVFAATLNVSSRTVQSWEQGLREPSDAALRMIQLIRLSPEIVGLIIPMRQIGRRRRLKAEILPSNAPRKKAV